MAAQYNSCHDLLRSQQGRTKEAATATIGMEQCVPLPVRQGGATKEDEDAILIHPEPDINAGHEMAI
jgi:hypothetical protein